MPIVFVMLRNSIALLGILSFLPIAFLWIYNHTFLLWCLGFGYRVAAISFSILELSGSPYVDAMAFLH